MSLQLLVFTTSSDLLDSLHATSALKPFTSSVVGKKRGYLLPDSTIFFEICTIKVGLTFHQALLLMLESGQWHRVPLIL
jgi:hypothetical protein